MILAMLVAQAASQFVEIDARWLLGAIAALVGVIGWFVKREFGRVEKVEDDVKRLLSGDVPWVQGMRLEISNLRNDINKFYRPRDN